MSASSRSRHHLTIADKNRLRRHHRQHPELTQEQLREWAYATFGQWVARSTVGHIVRAPEEVSANPEATRFQSGRYPDMEQELYALMMTRAAHLGVDLKRLDGGSGSVMSDSELWTKANEILKRTRGSDESVSVAWVHRFKKRHGLHRSQLKWMATEAASVNDTAGTVEMEMQMQLETEQTIEEAVQVSVGDKRSAVDTGTMEDGKSVRKRSTTVATAATGNRSHFVSSDDILLLTHVLAIKPWGFPYVMDGWQQVMEKLRGEESFRLDKTAGACQARLNLLLGHLKAGNTTALRKSGTEDEFDRKCTLIAEVAAKIEAYERTPNENNNSSAVAVETVPLVRQDTVVSIGIPDFAQERERMAKRRLELMERKMERELAAQKRHSEEQVARLEKLHHEQQKIQQEQHAQLLTTIQQQQAMMLKLIKSLAPTPSTTGNTNQG